MGNGNKVEFLVAVCALISSIIAIWVAWDQSRVMRAQQDGMVYPVVQIDGFISQDETGAALGLRFSNSGVGPALIESVKAKVDGTYIDTLEPYRGSLAPGYSVSWTALAGRALAPGAELDALRLDWTSDEITQAELDEAARIWGAIDIEICYCSVFQKCWITSMDVIRAEPVKSCTPANNDVFEAFGMSRIEQAPSPSEEAK